MAQLLKTVLVVLAISGFACGASVGPSSRIIGGDNADAGEFPYQVSLRYREAHFCGGSLITLQHVLTAAHCVEDFDYMPWDDLRVVTGTNSLARGGEIHEVRNITNHPDYVGGAFTSWVHDISVLTLTAPITESPLQRPIALPIEDVPDDVRVSVSGWGRVIFPSYSLPTALQKTTLSVVNNTKCQESVGRIPIYETHICALERWGVGVCSGDSGGPLVYEDRVVGIVSWGFTCALDIPDVYTRVYRYLFFIGRIIYHTEH